MMYGDYRNDIEYEITFTSKNIGQIGLNSDRLNRLIPMEDLCRKGLTYLQISDELNSRGFRKVRTNTPYANRDVSMGLLKYRKRLKKNDNPTITDVKERLVLGQLKNSQIH
jgi:hypothetical protein